MVYVDQYSNEYESIEEVKKEINKIENGCGDGCEYGDLCESCEDDINELRGIIAEMREEEKGKWEEAKVAFIKRAEALGYADVEDALDNNRSHGAYMQEHGSCSETILDAYGDGELSLADEEVGELVRAMDIARDRHENTDYDEMRSKGIDKELARFIK